MADILKIGRRGEIVLPRRVRAGLDLKEGDELVLDVEGDVLTLSRKARRFSEYLEGLRIKKKD
jgi:AbrB family looped-hinge helix DNA binding protein